MCLGLLLRQEASGYEIKKAFEERPLAAFQDASYGSIYPALSRLTAAGLLACRDRPQDGRPDKKIYRITQSGREAFRAALHRPVAPDKYRSDFLFVMMFADCLDRSIVTGLIDSRIADYRARIRAIESNFESNMSDGMRFVAGQGLAVYRAAIRYLEEHRHLVEGLAAQKAIGA